ncbi:MAG: phosphonate ABC transporter ATP-binding protein [Candidatus Atribacteria bacterium]|jgi:phosphonate transport system ATP-binding protein|nr:MAG: phosphonate ABC transporter ATP-binding protein [Candidatus Atribacteria bacterium]
MEQSGHLAIKNLTKVYERGQVVALKDLSFSVKKGEFLVVIGLSGSGKSTLLRCINRLIEPTSGSVSLDGVDVTSLPSSRMRRMRRGMGMVFQHFNLISRSTVLTNVLTGRLGYTPVWKSMAGWFSKADHELAMKSLERVGLEEKAYVRADELSGGQQQRVGIARALMQQPSLLLVDEPVSALDPATSNSIMQYFEEINQSDDITVLTSLHFLSLARRYGTRIIALKGGELVFDGLPSDIDDSRFKEIYGEEAEEVEVR